MTKIYLLGNQKFEGVENIELFDIEYIKPQIDITNYEALIFTSKNGVYSINSFDKNWKNIPSFAIAPKTAEIINSLGGKLLFTGVHSHGDDFAYELIPQLKNKKVLYIKALKTVSNLYEILNSNGVIIDELVAYKTSCQKIEKKFEENGIFIFPSPSSVECFLKQFQWKSNYKAIAIGKTTATYLPKNIEFYVSPKTSIEECVKLAHKIGF